MGLKPQSRHYMVVYHLADNQSSRKVFQSLEDGSYHNIVRTHPYAHPQHMNVVKHLSYVGVDVGTILDGSEASIKALHGSLSPGRHQEF
jgi:hypothetical protein